MILLTFVICKATKSKKNISVRKCVRSFGSLNELLILVQKSTYDLSRIYVLSSKSLAKLILSISISKIRVRNYMLQNFAGIGNWYTF